MVTSIASKKTPVLIGTGVLLRRDGLKIPVRFRAERFGKNAASKLRKEEKRYDERSNYFQ
ncbi:MAG: hypothetical protein NC121_15440 [Blautia sp.]|nr:hypothetical protein [Blautia sp.]